MPPFPPAEYGGGNGSGSLCRGPFGLAPRAHSGMGQAARCAGRDSAAGAHRTKPRLDREDAALGLLASVLVGEELRKRPGIAGLKKRAQGRMSARPSLSARRLTTSVATEGHAGPQYLGAGIRVRGAPRRQGAESGSRPGAPRREGEADQPARLGPGGSGETRIPAHRRCRHGLPRDAARQHVPADRRPRVQERLVLVHWLEERARSPHEQRVPAKHGIPERHRDRFRRTPHLGTSQGHHRDGP